MGDDLKGAAPTLPTDAAVDAFLALRNATLSIESARSSLLAPIIKGQPVNLGAVAFAIETSELHLANARAVLASQDQGGSDHA